MLIVAFRESPSAAPQTNDGSAFPRERADWQAATPRALDKVGGRAKLMREAMHDEPCGARVAVSVRRRGGRNPSPHPPRGAECIQFGFSLGDDDDEHGGSEKK